MNLTNGDEQHAMRGILIPIRSSLSRMIIDSSLSVNIHVTESNEIANNSNVANHLIPRNSNNLPMFFFFFIKI